MDIYFFVLDGRVICSKRKMDLVDSMLISVDLNLLEPGRQNLPDLRRASIGEVVRYAQDRRLKVINIQTGREKISRLLPLGKEALGHGAPGIPAGGLFGCYRNPRPLVCSRV